MKQTLHSLRMWMVLLVAFMGTFTLSAFADNVRVYYSNPAGWSAVYAYVYANDGDVNNGSWPGVQMTKHDNLTVNGTTGTWWTYDVPASLVNGLIIFNDNNGNQFPGSMQPGLEIGGSSKALTQNDVSSWTAATENGGGGGEQPAGDVYLYYYNSGNWSSVYVYVYADGNLSNGAWPGAQMTYDGAKTVNGKTGWYVYQVPANLVNGYAIFTESSTADASHRYPGDGEPGLSIGGKTHVFEGTNPSSWSDNVNTDPVKPAQSLKVWKNDGSFDLYKLTQNPQIRYSAGTVSIKNLSTGIAEVSYAAADIEKCTLVDEVASAIGKLSADEYQAYRQGNLFLLTGYQADARVAVYTVNGKQLVAGKTDAQGNASIDVSSLPKGVYILKTPKNSVKFVK